MQVFIIIIWIYIVQNGAAKKTCDFKLSAGFKATLQCESPTADDIIQAMEDLQNRNISGITSLIMASCNITKLCVRTFDFHTSVQLKVVRLDQNRLTSLPDNLFNAAALRNLKELDLKHNQLSYLSPKHFVYLQHLQILNLSCNRFRKLTAGLFTSNPIHQLHLAGNNIEILPEKFLEGNVALTLKLFNLHGNRLRKIPLFFLPKLKNLYLGTNNIRELPTGLFNSTNWSLLDTICLSSNQIKTLPEDLFYSPAVSRLKLFKLSHNQITVLSDEFFYSPYLQNLEIIDFSHNNITHLSDKLFHSPFLQNLQDIDLSYNQINLIPSKFLTTKALENLKLISLANNNIKSFSGEMLPPQLLRLCYLNLANNKISSIYQMVHKVMLSMESPGLESLKCRLDVSHNLLTAQQTYFIYMKGSISGSLDLSENKISKFEMVGESAKYMLDPNVAVPLGRKWLNTSGNMPFSIVNLIKVALDFDLNKNDQHVHNGKPLTVQGLLVLHVLIQAFPYEYDCNCDMFKYLNFLNSDFFKRSLHTFKRYYDDKSKYSILVSANILTSLKCGAPKHLNGKYLHQLSKTQFQCEYSGCTDKKDCLCVETPYNSTVRINCTNLQIKHIPFFQQNSSKLQIYLGYNDIYQFPIANTTISLHVVLFDVSYNYITNIPSTFFSQYQNIRHLNLAGNQLTSIPSADEWKILNSLELLELSGNNFTCNCSGLQLKKTLVSLNARTKAKVKDLNQIECSSPSSLKDRVIYNLPDSLFGCPFINLVLILTLTLSLILFFCIGIFIAYVLRYYINLFLFIHFGWRFCYSYTKEETLYDAFISYSTKDSDWVIDQLMNPLENLNPPYHLCLHERDFLIGVPICDNISKAIEGSKCTVCVVSKNWLESDWCQFEFRVAHCLATVEKKARLLVILKEEIPKDKIKGDLKYYMKTFTYLDSAHPLFRSRLLNDLPRPDVNEVKDNEDNELTLLLK